MSAAYIQGEYGATSGGTSVTVEFPSATTTGNFVAVPINFGSIVRTVLSVEDNKGNVYQRAGTRLSSAAATIETWYAYNVTGGAGHQITVTLDGTLAFWYVQIFEFSGVLTTDPFHADDGDFSEDSPSPFTIGTVTPPTDGALILVFARTELSVPIGGLPVNTGNITQITRRFVWYYLQPTATTYTAELDMGGDLILGKVYAFLTIAPTVWVPVRDWVEQEIPSSAFPGGVARILGDLWSEDPGGSPLPTIQARLYNLTDAVSVGESAALQSSDYPSACDFSVTLTPGTKRYRAEVTSDPPEVDIFFSSRGVGP